MLYSETFVDLRINLCVRRLKHTCIVCISFITLLNSMLLMFHFIWNNMFHLGSYTCYTFHQFDGVKLGEIRWNEINLYLHCLIKEFLYEWLFLLYFLTNVWHRELVAFLILRNYMIRYMILLSSYVQLLSLLIHSPHFLYIFIH